jgi:hypothetical protein
VVGQLVFPASRGPAVARASPEAPDRLAAVPGLRAALQQQGLEERRRRYPLFPRLLFVLDGTGPAGIDNRISALRAAARDLVPFLYEVPVLAAPLTDLLQNGPAEPVWRPVQMPDSRVSWYQSR